MAKIKYLLILFLFVANVASAQKDLAVYYVKGTVNIIKGSNSVAAKRGNLVGKENSLQVGQDGTCMLIAEKGRALQLKDPGTYSFQKLNDMILKGEKSETSKFFSYVYDNLFTKPKGDQMGITPVVFRGDALMKDPPDYSIMLSGTFMLTWKATGKIPVHLVLKQDNKIIIDTFFKRSTSMLLNGKLTAGKVYEWKTEERDTKQPKEFYYHFLIADKKDHQKILGDMKMLNNKISPELKDQVRQDIFFKWSQFYSPKHE